MAKKSTLPRRLIVTALVCAFGASLSGCSLSLEPKRTANAASAQSLLYNSDAGIVSVAKLLKFSTAPAWQRAPRAIDVENEGGVISIDSCGATMRSNGARKASYSAGVTAYRVEGLDRDILTVTKFTPKPSDSDPIRAAIDSLTIGKVSGAEEFIPDAVLSSSAEVERVLRLYSRSVNEAGETEVYSRYFLQLAEGEKTSVLVLSFLNAFSTSGGDWRLCLSPAECKAWAGSISFRCAA